MLLALSRFGARRAALGQPIEAAALPPLPQPSAYMDDALAVVHPMAAAPVVPYATPVLPTAPPAYWSPGPWHRWAAVIATSLMFGFVHEWWSVPPIAALSICLGYAYERTGNHWVPISMHLMFNASQTALFLATRPAG
jgi:hypothetical protein